MTKYESDPVPSPDSHNSDPAYNLPAYREYWDGKRWCAGEYEYLFGEPEVDSFLERNAQVTGGEYGQQEMGGRSSLGASLPRQEDTGGGIPEPPVDKSQEQTEII